MGARCSTDCQEVTLTRADVNSISLKRVRQEQAKRRRERSSSSNVSSLDAPSFESPSPSDDDGNNEDVASSYKREGVFSKVLRRTSRRASIMAKGEMSFQTFARHLQSEAEKANLAAAVAGGRKLENIEDEASKRAERRRMARRGETSLDALFLGCVRGDSKKVITALESGANVNDVDNRGKTPLMVTASSTSKEAVHICRQLQQKNADIHARDEHGWTPLLHACRSGKTDMVSHLLHARSDAMAISSDGKTALFLACSDGKRSVVDLLLEDKNAKKGINEKDAMGSTPLHYAVRDAGYDVIKTLIASSAKVTSKDIDGRTPMHIVCELGKDDHANVIKTIVRYKAYVDAQDRFKSTGLMAAVQAGHEELAILVQSKYKADSSLQNAHGDTAVKMAMQMGLMQFLRAVKEREGRRGRGESDNEEDEEDP